MSRRIFTRRTSPCRLVVNNLPHRRTSPRRLVANPPEDLNDDDVVDEEEDGNAGDESQPLLSPPIYGDVVIPADHPIVESQLTPDGLILGGDIGVADSPAPPRNGNDDNESIPNGDALAEYLTRCQS